MTQPYSELELLWINSQNGYYRSFDDNGAKFEEDAQALINKAVREARIDILKKLEALPNVYPRKINGEYTHVQAIYKQAITDELAQLQPNQDKEKTDAL